jgi:hypothetical protein
MLSVTTGFAPATDGVPISVELVTTVGTPGWKMPSTASPPVSGPSKRAASVWVGVSTNVLV